jgi:NDP-sugar pyrophosphorylase family protein
MMAVVLAGGVGSRLRPYTMNIPKPLLPLGDTPVIEVVLRQLAQQGFKRVVLTVGHLPHLLMAFLGDGERYGLQLEYAVEDQPLGTAGPLRRVNGLEDEVLVMNGDLLTTIDYRGLVERHRAVGAAATIALSERSVQIDYGVIRFADDGSLTRYEEKPSINYHVSTGVYVVSRTAVEFVADGHFDMPQLMSALADAGRRVHCEITPAYWQDIGRFADYEQASADFVQSPETFLPDSLSFDGHPL